ncbi:MAG TPA: hypothetical protein VJN71_10535, partial [Nitrososphaerales archaeon]|nr:hypothetical protein [Nitrososphaerales archaeon]
QAKPVWRRLLFLASGYIDFGSAQVAEKLHAPVSMPINLTESVLKVEIYSLKSFERGLATHTFCSEVATNGISRRALFGKYLLASALTCQCPD